MENLVLGPYSLNFNKRPENLLHLTTDLIIHCKNVTELLSSSTYIK